MPSVRMVPLVSAPSSFEAKLLVARLGAEGILWELRGGVDSVYPVGDIHVLVDEADLDRARDLLLVAEVEGAFAEPVRTRSSHRWLTAAVVTLLVAFALLRILGAAVD